MQSLFCSPTRPDNMSRPLYGVFIDPGPVNCGWIVLALESGEILAHGVKNLCGGKQVGEVSEMQMVRNVVEWTEDKTAWFQEATMVGIENQNVHKVATSARRPRGHPLQGDPVHAGGALPVHDQAVGLVRGQAPGAPGQHHRRAAGRRHR